MSTHVEHSGTHLEYQANLCSETGEAINSSVWTPRYRGGVAGRVSQWISAGLIPGQSIVIVSRMVDDYTPQKIKYPGLGRYNSRKHMKGA